MKQRRGRPFKKGQSGNPNGRQKGVPNKVTVEIKAFCRDLFERPEFRKKLLSSWDDLTLEPSYRALLTHYAFGKPVERHEIGLPGDFSRMTDAELKAQLAEALYALKAAG